MMDVNYTWPTVDDNNTQIKHEIEEIKKLYMIFLWLAHPTLNFEFILRKINKIKIPKVFFNQTLAPLTHFEADI